MRILVVSQYFWPENFRINELVGVLLGRGHEVTVLTGKPNYPDGRVDPDFERYPERYGHFGAARVVRVPMLARGRGSVRLLANYLSFAMSACLFGPRRLRDARFDIIFVFEPSPVTVGLPAVLLRRQRRVPVVFWVLDQWPETLAAVGVVRAPWLLRLVGRLVSFIYARCDLVLAQSRALLPQMARYCDDERKLRYFPNWADVDDAAMESVRPAPEVPLAPGRFTVMFAGNIGESQDFPSILSAAELLAGRGNVRWLIVGGGRLTDWVAAEIGRRGLSDSMVMLGRFPPERMPSLFRHADALLVALRGEPVFASTVPAKVQTYLAAGLPVLGMLDGEGARIIDESGAGLTCAAGDAAGLAAAVDRLAAMAPAERSALGRSGRTYSEREFDRDMLVDRLESWFEELRSDGGGQRPDIGGRC